MNSQDIPKPRDPLKPGHTLLRDAEACIWGPREKEYGDKLTNFTAIADLWSPVLGVRVTPEQVGLCMIQVKVARLVSQAMDCEMLCRGSKAPLHLDSVLDIAGYAGCLEALQIAQGKWARNTDE